MREFNLEQKIIHRLILQSFFLQDLGLFHGKMGISLFFFEYGKHTRCKTYTNIGEDLLSNIWEEINKNLPFYFNSGLSGIGWGIEYLLRNKFIKGDRNEICEEIDSAIMQINPKYITDETLATGTKGLYCYISSRLKDNDIVPFDSDFIENLKATNKDLKNKKGFISKYTFDVNSYFKRNHISEENYLSKPLGISNGIAGFLLQQIRK